MHIIRNQSHNNDYSFNFNYLLPNNLSLISPNINRSSQSCQLTGNARNSNAVYFQLAGIYIYFLFSKIPLKIDNATFSSYNDGNSCFILICHHLYEVNEYGYTIVKWILLIFYYFNSNLIVSCINYNAALLAQYSAL